MLQPPVLHDLGTSHGLWGRLHRFHGVAQRLVALPPQRVRIAGRDIPAGTVIWGAGVQASPAGHWLGAQTDRAGRISIAPDLSVKGLADVYALGDTALAEDESGRPLPALAQVAKDKTAGVVVSRELTPLLTKLTAALLPLAVLIATALRLGRRAILPLTVWLALCAAVFFLVWPWLWPFDLLGYRPGWLGTVDRFREFVIHRSAYQLKEADPHAWAVARLTGRAKVALVEIQSDEYGGGRPDRQHARLFARTMDELELDSGYGAYLDRIPGYTLASVNPTSMFGLNRLPRCSIAGHLALLEMDSRSLLDFTRMTGSVVQRIREAPFPIVAAVNGVAAGAGGRVGVTERTGAWPVMQRMGIESAQAE